MDGDVAPLKEISTLARKHNAMLFVDECHATGFLGDTGRGTEEHLSKFTRHKHLCNFAELPKGTIDILNSTLGKALGGAMGGYTTSRQPIVDLLRQRSRPYLFSNSLAPPVVAAAQVSLDMLMADPKIRASLLAKTHRFRTQMTTAGFTISGDRDHPICPVMLGDAK